MKTAHMKSSAQVLRLLSAQQGCSLLTILREGRVFQHQPQLQERGKKELVHSRASHNMGEMWPQEVRVPQKASLGEFGTRQQNSPRSREENLGIQGQWGLMENEAERNLDGEDGN